MVRHIVFFKLPDNSSEKIKELKDMLLGMKGEVEVLVDLEVGVNFSQSPRAYDLALITDFKSRDDLKTYSTHPKHLPIVEFIKKSSIETKVVDFER
jgi:hypothetical protein